MEKQSMKHLKLSDNLPEGDALDIMLRTQLDINKRILSQWANLDKLSEPERENLTKEYSLALIREVAELLDQINSKFWKKTRKPIDIEEVKYEIIDIQHFLNSLYLIWGMERDDVLKHFLAKAQENFARTERGY